MTVDTACSSSLVTTHLACQALRLGECDMALSAGVTLLHTPGMHVEFSRLRGLSADGRCRAFAAETEGTGWAEGCTAVVLRRLSDALRDGDIIHGVLRGTAVNHAGRTAPGLTVPSGKAQERLVRTALATSGLAPADIDYIEAHGTGTRLGDPIEGTALAAVFSSSRQAKAEPLMIGSAKSNIGHTQAAAGLAGMLKVLLAMRHHTLPPTLYAEKPTPAVDWHTANLSLVQEPQKWAVNISRPRRAGISAFGIGGTNAHAIVEEPPLHDEAYQRPLARPALGLPFVLSGQTDAALRQQAEKLGRHIRGLHGDKDDGWLGDVAYSLATTRSHFKRRVVLMAKDKATLLERLGVSSSTLPPARDDDGSEPPRLAMLFTGQGSQMPGMGKDLCDAYPVFRAALDDIAGHFNELHPPLLKVMHAAPGSDDAALLQRTEFAQPAIFALEVALWRLWDSWGVKPDFVFGHSVGELAAACVAGVWDLPDACRLVAARGRLMQAVSIAGSMVSLEACADETTNALGYLGLCRKIEVAACNTPSQTVVSGDTDAIEEIAAHFSDRGRKVKMLDVSHAFHSRHMDGMLSAYRVVAGTVRFHPPQIPLISSLYGQLAGKNQLERPAYWVQQARGAIQFAKGVQTLHQTHGVDFFLELGSHPVLSGLGAECLAATGLDPSPRISWMPSMVRGKLASSVIQRSLAHLHEQHVRDVNWAGYFAPFHYSQRVELPTYAFQREKFPSSQPYIHQSAAWEKPSRPQAQNSVGIEPDDLQFEIGWRPAVTDDTAAQAKGSSWGLFCPAGDVAWKPEVEDCLRRAEIQVCVFQRLEDVLGVDVLLCLWPSGSDHVPSQSRDTAVTALSLLHLATQIGLSSPMTWVTRCVLRTGSETPLRSAPVLGLGVSPLVGLMRTAQNEHPELRLRLVDLGEEADVFGRLVPATILRNTPECALRQGKILVPRLERVAAPKAPPPRTFRPKGAVLITGGLGGLGRSVAKWLANTYGVSHLILTSRRGIEAPGAADFIRELARIGTTAHAVACNVANLASVRELVDMCHKDKPLCGVIHAAGILDDGVLSSMTPEKFVAVFAPKVDGAWNLHQATQGLDLDFFVVFSSISGIIGMPGNANYAAANTFLDTLAHFRLAQGLTATSVAYGTWEGDGMAAKLVEAARSRFTQFGLDPLRVVDGLRLLEKAVESGRAVTLAAALDPERLGNYYRARGGIPALFHSITRIEEDSEQPRWSLRALLTEAEPSRHADIMLSMVRDTVASALGFAASSDVDVNRPLQDIGFDSLTAVLMRNQLANLTGLQLSARLIQYPNLKALSKFLLSELLDNFSSPSVSLPSSSSSTTPLSNPGSESPRLDIKAMMKGCLDPSFTYGNVTKPLHNPESLFVTGATGFVGAFMVYKLLTRGLVVHCLVRAASAEQAKLRLFAELAQYGCWEPRWGPQIHVILGEMSQPLFGLTPLAFDELANKVDAICHCGGFVDWTRALGEYIGPNVVSTHEVLRLAAQGRAKAVHVVSTMSTLPIYMGYNLTEADNEYGYAVSKYCAERMVAAARWRGAEASVYRLPFVTASSATGHFRRNNGDFLHNFIAGCLEVGSFPNLDGASLGAVLPVDYLCDTIASIMTSDRSRTGQDYDFSHGNAPSFNDFFQMLSAAGGAARELAPFGQWREKALAHAASDRTTSLARIASLIDGLSDKNAAAFVTGPKVGCDVLGLAIYPAPTVDARSVQRYVDRIAAARKDTSACAPGRL